MSEITNYWEEIKWIFEPDGALRDIYVKNINIEDWEKLIDFLNENHTIKFGTTSENKDINKIDKEYITKLLVDETKEMECKTASIIIEKIIINTHFFYNKEIEFDIDPKEINSIYNFERLVNFMNDISRILSQKVILTGENQIDFPLVEVDFENKFIKSLTQKEAEKLWDWSYKK